MIDELAGFPPSASHEAERFHDHWHVCHHYLRQLVADDDAVLDMLWVWLPRYEGPDLTLYRGESIDRVDSGRVGFAWTDKIEIGRMFASGLNAVGKGGVLLRAEAPASMIMAGPSKHSIYMGESEFTVDPRQLGIPVVLARFPPAH